MKKLLKTLYVFLFVVIIGSLSNYLQANSIQKISMDIYIKENGDAQVTEVWNCKVTEGTESYHPYYNLGNSEIKDLSVRDGNTKYTTLSSWNTSGTLSSKANKCGINKISNGVELCWGISTYGSHTYTVKYTITNFVSSLTDSQMIYWTLIPYDFSTSIGKVYIKIHTDFEIPDAIDVWGYGNYGGTAYVYDGYIEMQSDGNLAKDEYMTILVKFPSGTFNASNKLNNNFEHYFNMAEKGTTKHLIPRNSQDYLILLNAIFYSFILLVIIIVFYIKRSYKKLKSSDYGIKVKKVSEDVPYFRDIPCKKDIFRAYYIATQYGLTRKKTDVLGAIMLKWLKDGQIKIEQKETGMILKKENTVVVLTEAHPEEMSNEKEKELFEMLYKASKDGYLESKEFEKWCKRRYSKVLSWFEEVLKEEKEKLISEGVIKTKEKVKFKLFKSTKYTATSELREEAIELAGLRRYLNEYTLIKDRKALEVHLFEEYLIYAQIMGIAKKVAKEFKELYPEIIEQSNFASYDNVLFVQDYSTRGMTKASEAKSRAESYSSGGGGFSSGGGGGGSFGGGGGGGGFR